MNAVQNLITVRTKLRISPLLLDSHGAIWKSPMSSSLLGTPMYLSTTYPAFSNKAALAASSRALFLWLLSSSSITAITLNAVSHNTKSATFLSNVLRTDLWLIGVVISAEKATCDKTTFPGNVSDSRKNIFCSCGVNGVLALIVLSRFHCFGSSFMPFNNATAHTTRKKPTKHATKISTGFRSTNIFAVVMGAFR